MDDFIMWLGIVGVVVGPIWVFFHYVTKWKQAPRITREDEQLLDDLYNLARRLEERVATVERIAAADHPDWTLEAPRRASGDFPLPHRSN